MSDAPDKYANLTPLQRAVVALKEMRRRLELAQQPRCQPVAVIGLGCRFPGGANDPEAYWELLRDGRDAVVPVPRDRYDVERIYDPTPATPGRTYCREGGFLERVDLFSPEFFRIAPREAEIMDPQQRLLLEVAWEALEHAGQARALETVSTGVFVGATTVDYGTYVAREALRDNPHYGSGNTLNSIAGRLSYVFGLHGPCLAVDTACSSSLVTVHLACQSLRMQECDLALAGGVNLLLSPEVTVNISQAKILAADGRCKAFDASADGYGRGEGCGIVVLKRLEDALRDRDQVLAVLLGSAVNHDGASGGFTVPNGSAQQALLRRAWSAAGVSAADLDYLEAHGTGTPLGDPIEIHALGAALRNERPPDRPLAVGSVKTNLGHLESAAGVAALIKVVLALQHERIPAQLHLRRPSPHIRWSDLGVRVVTEPLPWPRSDDRRRVAGINSFGLSGTNAHVVVAEAPTPRPEPRDDVKTERPFHALTLSAQSEAALQRLAARLADHMEARTEQSLADVCFSLNTGRAAFNKRASLVAAHRSEVVHRLRSLAKGERTGVEYGEPSRRRAPRIGFLFPGGGALVPGLGRDLYRHVPAFREALDRCDALLRPVLGRALLDLVEAAHDDVQPGGAAAEEALFAFEYALASLWTSWGVRPTVVVGTGIGELAAACAAGVFGPEDALRLIAARRRALEHRPATEAEAAALAEFLGQLDSRRAEVSLVSGTTGRPLTTEELRTPEHWLRNEHGSGPHAAELQELSARGIALLLELGPRPTLIDPGRQQPGQEERPRLPTRDHDREELQQALITAGTLWVHGVDVDWGQVDPDPTRRRVALPTYPFERRRCWVPDRMLSSDLLEARPRDQARRSAGPSAGPFYRMEWVARSAKEAVGPGGTPDEWLIFCDRRGVGARVAQSLLERGTACSLVHAGEGYRRNEDGSITVDPRAAEHFRRLLREELAPRGRLGILHLWSLDVRHESRVARLEDDLELVLASSLHLSQALAAQPDGRADAVWWVTQGAQSIDGSSAPSPAAGSLLGFVRVMASEDPATWRGIVDLDPSDSIDRAAASIVRTVRGPRDEDQIAYRGGSRFVARLLPDDRPLAGPVQLRADATYLLTGGCGALGLEVARWLAGRGARNLALLGRSGATRPAAQGALAELRRSGIRLRVLAADVAEPGDVRRSLEDIAKNMPPLRGIVHLAGVLHDGLLADQDWESFQRVLRPKAAGAWNLHEQTSGTELDFFVLFSSAAVLGAPGQSGYAAANACLDSLAELRRKRGLPAVSIQWGPWRDTGMATGLDLDAHWRRQGAEPLSTEEALEAFGQLLTSEQPSVAVLRFHWERLFSPELPSARWSHLRELASPAVAPPPSRATSAPDAAHADIRGQLEQAPEEGRQALAESYVGTQIGRVIGSSEPSAMDPQAPLIDLGMDSLMAVQLRNSFRSDLGIDVTIGELLEGVSIAQLSRRILRRLGHVSPKSSETISLGRDESS